MHLSVHSCRHHSGHWRLMDEKALPLNQVSCDTSNLSLDRGPTGKNTNSRKIQRRYIHFLATLYLLFKPMRWQQWKLIKKIHIYILTSAHTINSINILWTMKNYFPVVCSFISCTEFIKKPYCMQNIVYNIPEILLIFGSRLCNTMVFLQQLTVLHLTNKFPF
jgi:hypothetical protein